MFLSDSRSKATYVPEDVPECRHEYNATKESFVDKFLSHFNPPTTCASSQVHGVPHLKMKTARAKRAHLPNQRSEATFHNVVDAVWLLTNVLDVRAEDRISNLFYSAQIPKPGVLAFVCCLRQRFVAHRVS